MRGLVEYVRDMWPVYVMCAILLVLFAAITIDDRKLGWHYHTTCEEVTVDMGDFAVDMWRCKGEKERQ